MQGDTKTPRRSGRGGPARRLGSLPTASGGIARAAYARALEAHINVEPLLETSGLTTAQMKNPHARIAVRDQIRFLDKAAAALADDLLGFELAGQVDLRELGLLYYVLASSENLGIALTRLTRFSSILNEGVRIACRQASEQPIVVTFDYVGVQRTHDCHQIEFFLTILLRLCRALTGRQLTPIRIAFRHRRRNVSARIKTFFNCKIEFDANRDRMVFQSAVRSGALVGADPYLNLLLLEYCEEMLAKRRNKSGFWRANVEHAVAPLLPHGEAKVEEVAKRLGMSQRTLTRLLATENVTFTAILNELRLGLARRYLAEPGMRIAEVAWLLGYKGTSAFSNAFKRWTGASPSRRRGMKEPTRPADLCSKATASPLGRDCGAITQNFVVRRPTLR